MPRKFTDQDAKSIWNLVHYVHIGKIQEKEANHRLENFHQLFYSPQKSSQLKTNFRQKVAAYGGMKEKQLQKQTQKSPKKSTTSSGMSKEQFAQFMELQKAQFQAMQSNMMDSMMELNQQNRDALQDEIREPMDLQFSHMSKSLKKMDEKTEQAVEMLVGGASFWDISWGKIPSWTKSQFKKGMGSIVTLPIKLSVKAVSGLAHVIVIDPLTVTFKVIGGSGYKGIQLFVGVAMILGSLNMLFHAQHFQLPENQIEINGNRLCFNSNNFENFGFDSSKVCLLNQSTFKTPADFYISERISHKNHKRLSTARKHVKNVVSMGKTLTVDQYKIFATETVPQNAPGAFKYGTDTVQSIASATKSFVVDNVRFAVTHVIAESTVGKGVSSMLSFIPGWNGGKKTRKKSSKKSKKKSKKGGIRKHSGINQQTGRLKKGYKYSGKKLKSGLPKIIKINKQLQNSKSYIILKLQKHHN